MLLRIRAKQKPFLDSIHLNLEIVLENFFSMNSLKLDIIINLNK